MTDKAMPSETESPKPKKKMAMPKSFSKAFYEKYRSTFNEARKDLGFKLGGYGALLKIKKDDPKAFNRIMEDTAKKIKQKEKKNKMSVGGLSTKKYMNPITIVDNLKNK
jgi:hypothetical protein